jgi:hypothetical protein
VGQRRLVLGIVTATTEIASRRLAVQNFEGFFTDLGSPRDGFGGEKPLGFINTWPG